MPSISSDTLWAWADLCLRRIPEEENGLVGDLLRKLRQELPECPSEQSLRKYRRTAIAFPIEKRKKCSFTVHAMMVDYPDHVRDGMTVKEAREFLARQ